MEELPVVVVDVFAFGVGALFSLLQLPNTIKIASKMDVQFFIILFVSGKTICTTRLKNPLKNGFLKRFFTYEGPAKSPFQPRFINFFLP